MSVSEADYKIDWDLVNNGKYQDADGKVHSSHLLTFEACPNWVKLLLQGKETVEGDVKKRDCGSLVHNMIKLYYDVIDEIPTHTQIERTARMVFIEEWEKYKIPYMKARAEKSINRFIYLEKQRQKTDKPYLPTFTEEKLTSGDFTGTIDWYHKETATLKDWKVSSYCEMDTDKYIQGTMYKYLITKSLGLPVKKVVFEMLFTEQTLVMPNISFGWLMKKYKTMLDCIERNYFKKKKGVTCSYCPLILPCQCENMSLWE